MLDDSLEDVSVYSMKIAGPDILFLALTPFLFFAIILLCEKIKNFKVFAKFTNAINFIKEKEYDTSKKVDEDVARERDEIE